jgi:hypothetical protein
MSVHLNQIDNTDKNFPLIPSNILPRSTKRLRKTEPKRHIEQINDDDDDDEDDDYNDQNLSVLKRMKVEDHNDINFDCLSSPTNSIFCLNFSNNEQQQQNDTDDDDIIYVGSFQPKSPATPNFEELLQIISTNE